ncbi:hypothetical protein ID866_4640 [Astraeus odoratus]|nr:hypothetical protein ID866_4640 [Astraeus odoratus]
MKRVIVGVVGGMLRFPATLQATFVNRTDGVPQSDLPSPSQIPT